MKMTIDTDQIALVSKDAEKIFISKDGEEQLIQLLEMQEMIEKAIDEAKKLIEEKGLTINPYFKSIEGDRVKVSYRYFGVKYYLEDDKLDQVPAEMYTKEITTKYKVNTDIVEVWAEKNKGLPFGITESNRKKSLNIALKKTE